MLIVESMTRGIKDLCDRVSRGSGQRLIGLCPQHLTSTLTEVIKPRPRFADRASISNLLLLNSLGRLPPVPKVWVRPTAAAPPIFIDDGSQDESSPLHPILDWPLLAGIWSRGWLLSSLDFGRHCQCLSCRSKRGLDVAKARRPLPEQRANSL